ncbi:Mitotic checkpoint protein BUB3-3 [Nymphaea thermarum]|nr:Mitotic checkpoint protein BUB3-3 [Nymphaea thermarum]
MNEEGGGNRLMMEGSFDDAITRIRFSPHSNNLLASSWDSTLRLYDGETSSLRLTTPSESPLLDCCFEDDALALTVGADFCVRRYDLGSGSSTLLGKHDDLASCVEYSKETNQVISAGFDKQLIFWDTRETNSNPICAQTVKAEVDSMSLSGVHLLVATAATIGMYDLRALRGPVQSSESTTKYHVRCIRSAPNGRDIASTSNPKEWLRCSFCGSILAPNINAELTICWMTDTHFGVLQSQEMEGIT